MSRTPQTDEAMMWMSSGVSSSAQRTASGVRLDVEQSGPHTLIIDGGPILAWLTVNTDRAESDVIVPSPILDVAAEIAPEVVGDEKRVHLGWCLLHCSWGCSRPCYLFQNRRRYESSVDLYAPTMVNWTSNCVGWLDFNGTSRTMLWGWILSSVWLRSTLKPLCLDRVLGSEDSLKYKAVLRLR